MKPSRVISPSSLPLASLQRVRLDGCRGRSGFELVSPVMESPTGPATERVLAGFRRKATGRGRGQAKPCTADNLAAILATAALPRTNGRGTESDETARARGLEDSAIAALLFQGGLRRSEVAALRWSDVEAATDGNGLLVTVRTSKTNQDGGDVDIRYSRTGQPPRFANFGSTARPTTATWFSTDCLHRVSATVSAPPPPPLESRRA